MENLVLANAGVDAFEEVFKLIYAKLYDEANAAQGGKTTSTFNSGLAAPRPGVQGQDQRAFQRSQREVAGRLSGRRTH